LVDIVYRYDSVPTIKRFSESEQFIRGLMGPFGSGKSSGCVIELVKLAAMQPKGVDGKRRARFAAIRNTYPQLNDTTIKTVHDWLPPHSFGTYLSANHRYIIDRMAPDLHIEILFRALDRPEHVANLLSLELTAAWVNEAREVPWAVIQALQGRVGRFPAAKDGGCVRPGIILDTNPPDTDSWWYELFEEKRPDNAQLFKQPSGVSPDAENRDKLPANYYENLLKSMDPDQVTVYVHGHYGFLKDGKPVYIEYNDSTHCKPCSPVPGVKIQRGWDFGLTPACVFSQLLPSGKWITFDELCADSLGIEKFSTEVLLHCATHYQGYEFEDIGDPAGNAKSQTDEKTCFEILRGKGIIIQGGEQTLAMRIEAVKWSLRQLANGEPMFVIDPKCKTLRKGYQGRYRYKKVQVAGSEERYHLEPDKNEYSHPHDANQYVAVKLFGMQVRNIAQADEPVERYRRRKAYGSAWAA
jgi:hypothetical protein